MAFAYNPELLHHLLFSLYDLKIIVGDGTNVGDMKAINKIKININVTNFINMEPQIMVLPTEGEEDCNMILINLN